MQVGSDRGLRTLQDVRDLGDRKILEVEQHDHCSLRFGKRLDRGDEVDVREGLLDLTWLVPLEERSDPLAVLLVQPSGSRLCAPKPLGARTWRCASNG